MSARVRQIAWTLAYLDDLRSDFSVLHRVDEIEQLPAPRFFAYCYRLTAYQGIVASLQRRQQAERQQRQAAGPVGLAQWAREHAALMEQAAEQMTEGR